MTINTQTNSQLIRTNIWANETKEVLQEDLMLDKHVRWVTDFPDGDTLNIPTFGESTVRNYQEGADITVDDATTGNFTLTIDKYYQSGYKITEKFKQDSFYVSQAEAIFSKNLSRAILEQKESDIATIQASQTASDPNVINGYDHRWGALGSSGILSADDIRKVRLSLDKSKVLKKGRSAYVDPTAFYDLLDNTGVSDIWRQDVYGANDMVKEGFIGRFFGIDFFESLFLDSAITETIAATGRGSGSVAITSGYANMFLGEEAIIGAMRTTPSVMQFFDEKSRSDVTHTTVRYGLKLYRPESLIVVLSA